HLDPPPAHVERIVIGVVEKGLQPATQPLHLVATEGGDVVGQVEVAGQDQVPVRRQRDLALEPGRVLEGDVVAQPENPRRDHHGGAVGIVVGGDEGGQVVGDAVTHGAVVAHVDAAQHLAQEHLGHVLDDDVVDAHHAATGAGQVQ